MLKGLQEFFHYSKNERRGIYVMIVFILMLMVGLYVDDYFYPHIKDDLSRFEEILAQNRADSLSKVKQRKLLLKPFYADTASLGFWEALGFSTSTAHKIKGYQNKVEPFRKPTDLFKIYGIDSTLVKEIVPYVRIRPTDKRRSNRKVSDSKTLKLKPFDPNSISQEALLEMGLKPWEAKGIVSFRTKFRPFKHDSDIFKVYNIDSALAKKMHSFVKISERKYKPELKPVVLVNVNTADSLQLISVKGIGAYTAHKILEARSSLGGFYSLEQLAVVYPLTPEKLLKMENQLYADGPVEQLNINTATFKELLAHPYLTFELVKGIVHFREKIRPFKSVDELKQIELFNEEIFSKIAPYLNIE
jgi:DNA uptake protein ComE-like DNA-binding protein